MTKAVFFTNPLSHNVAKHGSILAKSAVQDPSILRYMIHDFSLLPDYIALLAKKNIDLVFIEGGDGTIHGVLTEIMHHKQFTAALPKFIILAGGMTNLIAGHVGTAKPSSVKIEAILNEHKNATTIQLPLLKIEYDGIEQFGFLFSTGALPNGTRYCLDNVHSHGINGAMAVGTTLMRVLFTRGKERDIILRPSAYALETDKNTVDGDHILSLVTTLPSLMIGLNPFWGTGNGTIHISHVRANAKHHVRNVMRLLKSKQSEKSIRKLDDDGFQSWSVDDAVLSYSGDMVLDGEFMPHTESPISISATPPFSFVVSL